MNQIINKPLITGDKAMPEMHLRQSCLHRVLVDNLQKTKKRLQKFKETRDSRYIY